MEVESSPAGSKCCNAHSDGSVAHGSSGVYNFCLFKDAHIYWGNPLIFETLTFPMFSIVKSPKIDYPRCDEPAQIDRDLFEKPWWGDD